MSEQMGGGIAFLAVGLFGELFALYLALRSVRRLRLAGDTWGTVISNEEHIDSTGKGSPRKFYMPVVAFSSSGGQSIQFTATHGQGKPLEKGSRLRVLYDPAKPEEASIGTFASLWLFPILTSVMASPFLMAGLSMLL